MSRIYDALEQAGADQSNRSNVFDFPDVARSMYSPALIAKLRDLYRLIHKEFEATNGQFVQLIAARRGTGTTRISRALASMCAEELDKRVLVVDADAGFPHFCHYGIQPRNTWADTLRRNEPVTDACHAVGRTGIFLMKAWSGQQGAASVLESPDFEASLEELRLSFDLILVDSAAVEDSSDGIDIAPVVDGSVLVVRAEKTKWQVAVDVRDRIEARGGYVLGALLNELRFHIPALIYDRL
jgi:MinD-like ATPase involved in chromosome partitioning or flagellar assembly